MKKTLLLYGVLVFAGGLAGGALTDAVCRSRPVTAAQAAPQVANKSAGVAAPPLVTTGLVLVDAAGRPRVKFEVTDEGQAGLAMYDRDNHPRAQIVIDNQGAPSVRLYDTSNKLRISLEVSSDGIPTVRLMDNGGHARELLGVDAEGDGGLDFYARDGTVLRELP